MKQVILSFLMLFPVLAIGANLPEGFVEQVVVENLDPTKMIIVPDGRIFIAEKSGRILVVKNDELLPDPFLDIPVDNFNERGLSGFALDPDFDTNNYFYVYYTVLGGNRNRLSRFIANGDYAIPESEEILLEFDPLNGSIHNGGEMHFGTDGKLYIAVGDGGSSERSQDLGSLHGKILRLNPDGSIPEDNPFYDSLDGKYRSIWAYGFRNPFTFAVQAGTGRIFVNDVGSFRFEEVNQIFKGKNYGWDINEGVSEEGNPANFQNPIHAYDHGVGCAVIGAAFYNPAQQQFPDRYVGKYLFGDYCKGFIKVLNPETGAIEETFATDIDRPVSMAVAPDGSLYYLERAGLGGGSATDNTSSKEGRLWKVSFLGSGAPFIAVQPKSTLSPVGEDVTFSLRAIGQDLSYQWFLDNVEIIGANQESTTVNNVQLEDDGSLLYCLVSNDEGEIYSDTITLNVTSNTRPQVTIQSPLNTFLYKGGDTIRFSGSAFDAELGGDLDSQQLAWRIDFHHDDHVHPALSNFVGKEGEYVIPRIGETSANVWYRLYLSANDGEGLSNTGFVDIFPQKTEISLMSEPPGLEVRVDGTKQFTPYSFTSVVGITRYIRVASVLENEGTFSVFDTWSDGSLEATRSFDAPEEDLSLSFTVREVDKGKGEGLRAYYFQEFEHALKQPFKMTRIDSTVNFDWGFDAPVDTMHQDFFSVRWDGELQPIYDDVHFFTVDGDDGYRLWVDDKLLIDRWVPGAIEITSQGIFLEGGKKYPIRLEFFENGGIARAKLFWETRLLNKQIIPFSQLFPSDIERLPITQKLVYIYPNPAQDELNILLNFDQTGTGRYRILDAQGNIVRQGSVEKMLARQELLELDISTLANGYYLFELQSPFINESFPFVKF